MRLTIFSIVLLISIVIMGNVCSINHDYMSEYSAVSDGNYVIVDMSRPSTERRFVIYSATGEVLYKTWVAHGKNSGKGIYATKFSNKEGSEETSLGTYEVGEAYVGRHGYSYRLIGRSSSDSNVYNRDIVIHSAAYIGYGRTGHSDGCLALPQNDIKYVFKFIHRGTYIYVHD